MPAEGGAASQLTRNGGFEAFESLDGRLLYYTKGRATPGLWSIPVGGGEESAVVDGAQSGYWAVTEKGIYFVEFALDAPRGVGKQVDLYSYPSRQTKPVAPLGKAVGSAAPAFSATRDGRLLLWT